MSEPTRKPAEKPAETKMIAGLAEFRDALWFTQVIADELSLYVSTGVMTDDESQAREKSASLARQACISFCDACEASDPKGQKSNYDSMRISLGGIWEFAKFLPISFCDLLALIDAATRQASFEVFGRVQRIALFRALYDLTKPRVLEATVDEHIDRFARLNIDATGPIRGAFQ